MNETLGPPMTPQAFRQSALQLASMERICRTATQDGGWVQLVQILPTSNQVDACGEGYDFTSVMHYSLKSFAIDYSQNTVTPKDSSITEAGNTQLSAGDIKKLQCM